MWASARRRIRLIVRELLLRRRSGESSSAFRRPWSSMAGRDGAAVRLTFQVFRPGVRSSKGRERGYGVNRGPPTRGSSFSHALLATPRTASPCWTGWATSAQPRCSSATRPTTPPRLAARNTRFDSKLTQAVREIARTSSTSVPDRDSPHATRTASPPSGAARPSAVLPWAFRSRARSSCRTSWSPAQEGPARDPGPGFPERHVVQLISRASPPTPRNLRLPGCSASTPASGQRLADERKSVQNAAALVTTSLQKRLLSSIEASGRPSKSIGRRQQGRKARPHHRHATSASCASFWRDDDRAALPEEQVQAEEDAQMQAATEARPPSTRP